MRQVKSVSRKADGLGYLINFALLWVSYIKNGPIAQMVRAQP